MKPSDYPYYNKEEKDWDTELSSLSDRVVKVTPGSDKPFFRYDEADVKTAATRVKDWTIKFGYKGVSDECMDELIEIFGKRLLR